MGVRSELVVGIYPENLKTHPGHLWIAAEMSSTESVRWFSSVYIYSTVASNFYKANVYYYFCSYLVDILISSNYTSRLSGRTPSANIFFFYLLDNYTPPLHCYGLPSWQSKSNQLLCASEIITRRLPFEYKMDFYILNFIFEKKTYTSYHLYSTPSPTLHRILPWNPRSGPLFPSGPLWTAIATYAG